MAIVVLSTFLEQRHDPTLHYPWVYITGPARTREHQIKVLVKPEQFAQLTKLLD